MASMASTVGKQIPGFMALGLMGKSVGMAKRSLGSFEFDKNKKSKKKKDGSFMKDTVDIMVGVPLVGVVAGQVNLLP